MNRYGAGGAPPDIPGNATLVNISSVCSEDICPLAGFRHRVQICENARKSGETVICLNPKEEKGKTEYLIISSLFQSHHNDWGEGA